MRYRVLGGTGIEVSVHCLGTMMFGAVGNPDHDDCVRIIHAALEGGVNVVDTADMYSSGESEQIVGKALRGRRDEVVLATKVHFQMGEGLTASPITYAVDGKQYVAIASSTAIFSFGLFEPLQPIQAPKIEVASRP